MRASMRTNIVESASDQTIADWITDTLTKALAQGARLAISVPGGSTPFPIFANLAKRDLDWRRISVWPGDDRIVPEDNPASNVGRIRSILGPAGAKIVALSEHAEPPHFALVWLGMGADGHVASLFPNTNPQAWEPRRLIRITPDPLPPEAPFDRLSLTIPALINADALMFVIRGAEKHALFGAAAKEANDLPIARLLKAWGKPVTCFT